MSARRILLATASVGFCVAGLGTLVQGAMVPVEAQVAQTALRRDFERDLKTNLAKAKLPLPEPRPSREGAPMPPPPPPRIEAGQPLAKITVKRLEVEDVILAGPASHDDLTRGPMVVKAPTAESPVTVLAAHRDTHFLFIRDLREGDIVALQYVTGEVERYRVTYFETVRWDEFAYPLDPARPLLALTTCYPFGGTEYGGPWRRVAWAERLG